MGSSMARNNRKPESMVLGDGGLIEAMFDEIAAELPVTPVDRALARIALNGLPALLEFLEDDGLLGALTAIDPKLKLSDLDEACSKLEDLAINLLASARGCRHTVEAHGKMHGSGTLAAKVIGEEARAALDKLEELAMLDDDEVARNAKLIRAVSATRHRA